MSFASRLILTAQFRSPRSHKNTGEYLSFGGKTSDKVYD
jgi:hypothetical protein